jgi:hypothetical protein
MDSMTKGWSGTFDQLANYLRRDRHSVSRPTYLSSKQQGATS